MKVSRSGQVGSKNWVFSGVVAALLASACGSGQTQAKVAQAPSNFMFAPRVGQVYRHEMKHLDEFTVSAGDFR